ncbi:hypothetical protein PMAYCL1PPCAC_16246, partial [Pristionchus mayeri]
LLVFILVAQGTEIKFMNNCGHQVQVMQIEKGLAEEQQTILEPGSFDMATFDKKELAFKASGSDSVAEFKFNQWGSEDLYDLRVGAGSMTPMMLQTNRNGGHTIDCRDNLCPEAYHNILEGFKTFGAPTGGMFTLIFCPP